MSKFHLVDRIQDGLRPLVVGEEASVARPRDFPDGILDATDRRHGREFAAKSMNHFIAPVGEALRVEVSAEIVGITIEPNI